MPYQTGIRLLCVTQNPANGFPARLLAESPAPALRRNQWTAPLATGSTTAPVSVAGAVLCLAFGPQRPTAARSARKVDERVEAPNDSWPSGQTCGPSSRIPSVAPALRRNPAADRCRRTAEANTTGCSTTAPVSVAGAVLCLAFGPQRPTAARSAGFGVMVALVVGPTPETLWYYGNWLQPIDAKNHPIETGGLGRAAALVPDRKLFLRPGGANSRSELL